MRKIFWMLVFVGGYIWVISSGHDDFALHLGKKIYARIVDWLEDAEVDFHLKKKGSHKKTRRWN